MFYRRFYYDVVTGEPVSCFMARGDVVLPAPEEDFAVRSELSGRSEADTGRMEWLEEDAALETLFASKKPTADVSQIPPALVFTDWPEPELPELSDSDAVTGDEFLSMVEDVL